jgi:hypothetical protein
MSKPIPINAARIAVAGDSSPVPAPVTQAGIDLGYVKPGVIVEYKNNAGDTIAETEYVEVTHALRDRTFVYRVKVRTIYPGGAANGTTVECYDIRALFIPVNKLRPDFNDGTWLYGRDDVLQYLSSNQPMGNPLEPSLCVLFVSKSAEVLWTVEGISGARELHHVLRPQVSPRDATPIEFRGLYDCCVPDCCDS